MALSTKHRRDFSSAISYSDLAEGADYSQLGRMMLAICLVLFGISLIVLGVTWNRWFPAKSYWTTEQAKEYTTAALALKEAADSKTRRRGEPDPPELVAAQARWDKIHSQLAQSQSSRSRSQILVLAVGGVCTVAGGVAAVGSRVKRR